MRQQKPPEETIDKIVTVATKLAQICKKEYRLTQAAEFIALYNLGGKYIPDDVYDDFLEAVDGHWVPLKDWRKKVDHAEQIVEDQIYNG